MFCRCRSGEVLGALLLLQQQQEVLVRLPGGAMVVAIITNASASGMALRQGDDVTAMFKASSVFLATQA